MKKQKIPTGIGVIIILIVTITIGVFVWKVEKNQLAIEQPQVPQVNQKYNAKNNNQSDEKALEDSKITTKYTNNTYGLEFEYPQNLVISQDATDSLFGLSDRPDGHWVINVSVSANTNNFSLVQAFNKELARYKKPERNIITSDIIVGGKPAKKFSIQNPTDNGNAVVVIVDGKNIITIYGTDSTTFLKTIFETVLNSFKFIK
ncbi:MAG: hypothetical protein NT136_03375 [Candidatus Moranbacteria bacterium]|nr:hypothetical protein [Candidatus Moranbacteria bacterium]